MERTEKAGFTLVELLVVIAIIGILIALLMPAVQNARESARILSCKNNLNQLALAAIRHRETHGHFPTGGWGWGWAGEPEQGFTKNQPGGWAYNILPFIEQENVHQMGRGLPEAQKRDAIRDRLAIPIGLYNCPTRRRAATFPYVHSSPYYNASITAGGRIARTDYAVNAGHLNPGRIEKGPATIAEGLAKTNWHSDSVNSTGISYLRSEVKIIPDGDSNTYLIGERYANPDHYFTGSPASDDQGWDVGYDWDTLRWGKQSLLPRPDTPGLDNVYIFGSAHMSGWNVAFCDRSVRMLSYSIDPMVHEQLANRKDGTPIDQSKIQ